MIAGVTYMKTFLIGAGLAALVAVPALALQSETRPDRPDRTATMTRADVQAGVQQRFAVLDANRDGTVTQAEADAASAQRKQQRQTGHAERRDRLFAMLDTDKNGQLSRAEFTAERARPTRNGDGKGRHMRMGMRGHGGPGGMAQGRMGGRMFAMMDANKDGKVTLAEASARPLAMFDRADADKDGKVTPEERRAARGAMREAWQAKRG
jgi:hypothetical protein